MEVCRDNIYESPLTIFDICEQDTYFLIRLYLFGRFLAAENTENAANSVYLL
jgi:hypothetical protein